MDLLYFIIRSILSLQHSSLRPGDDADVYLGDEELGVAGGAWHDLEYLQIYCVSSLPTDSRNINIKALSSLVIMQILSHVSNLS